MSRKRGTFGLSPSNAVYDALSNSLSSVTEVAATLGPESGMRLARALTLLKEAEAAMLRAQAFSDLGSTGGILLPARSASQRQQATAFPSRGRNSASRPKEQAPVHIAVKGKGNVTTVYVSSQQRGVRQTTVYQLTGPGSHELKKRIEGINEQIVTDEALRTIRDDVLSHLRFLTEYAARSREDQAEAKPILRTVISQLKDLLSLSGPLAKSWEALEPLFHQWFRWPSQ